MRFSKFSGSPGTTMFQGRLWRLQAVLLMVFLFVSGVIAAQIGVADEPEVLWEDDFSTLDSSFGEPTEDLFVKDKTKRIANYPSVLGGIVCALN